MSTAKRGKGIRDTSNNYNGECLARTYGDQGFKKRHLKQVDISSRTDKDGKGRVLAQQATRKHRKRGIPPRISAVGNGQPKSLKDTRRRTHESKITGGQKNVW